MSRIRTHLRTPSLWSAAFLALGASCAAGISQEDSTRPPTVASIYAVDTAGSLQDVLLYSATDPRVTAKFPASYGALRVEFDQPIAGSTIAHLNDLNGVFRGDVSGGFCSPLASGAAVRLLDATGAQLASSVCYDPSSLVGGNPNAVLTIGAPGTASPFTCQTFTRASGDANGAILAFGASYSLVLAPGITGSNGKALQAPTSAGWSNGGFTFPASGFEIMAAGYQSDATGYFSWLDKPFAGYNKDLDATPATFLLPATSNTFQVILTAKAKRPAAGAPPIPVTITRADGSAFGASAVVRRADNRMLLVTPDGSWEPGLQYSINVGAVPSADGTRTLAGATYKPSAATAPLKVTSVSPENSLIAAVPVSSPINVNFQAPVAAASAVPAHFTLTGPSGPVAVTVKLVGGTNNQTVQLKPASPLASATTYTVSATNVTVDPSVPSLGGQAFQPFTSQFVTANFRIQLIHLAGSTASIDRATDVDPSVPVSGALTVDFTTPAAGVTSSTLQLAEAGADGTAGAALPITVTAADAKGISYSVAVSDPSYKLKLGRKYLVIASQAITEAGSGLKLNAERCFTGDCSDVRSFTTLALAASIKATTDGKFTVTFNEPVEPSSVTAGLATELNLFAKDASGALTPVPVTCALNAAATKISCAPKTGTPPLTPNSTYVANAVFLQTTPVVVASTLTSGGKAYPVDQSTGQLFGPFSATFVTPCP